MLFGGFAPALGDAFDLFDWGTLAGSFDTLLLPDLDPGAGVGTRSELYTTGTLSVGAPAAVPEPGTWALLSLAAAGAGWRGRRKRRAAADAGAATAA